MSGKRRPARKSEAQYSPHEETAKPRDLPKLLGQELQAHFKPLQDLPHRMFTLLMQLKNERRGGSGWGSATASVRSKATTPSSFRL